MESIMVGMAGHDFAERCRSSSSRKFPQRSQSLRVKSSVSSLIPRLPSTASRWSNSTGNGRSGQQSTAAMMVNKTKLLLSSHDLIVQSVAPITPSSASCKQSLGVKDSVSSASSFTSLTSVMRLNRRTRDDISLPSHTYATTPLDSKPPTTVFIDCSTPPNFVAAISAHQRNQQNTLREEHSTRELDGKYSSPTATSTRRNRANSSEHTSMLSEDASVEDEGVVATTSSLSCSLDDCLEGSEFDEYDDYDYEDYADEDNELELFDRSSSSLGGRLVHLRRHCRSGLGLSIQGGSDFRLPVTVAAVRANSRADICGQIFVGDQIVSVNDVKIDETTCHADVLRLLSECGDAVSIVLRHCKAPNNWRRRWRRREASCFVRDRFSYAIDGDSSKNLLPSVGPKTWSTAKSIDNSCSLNPLTRINSCSSSNSCADGNNSVNNLSHQLRIDLFLAAISQYVTYSDKIRDSSFELRTATGDKSFVIQCTCEQIASQWNSVIKSTIGRLSDNFMNNFNKNFPQREHIFFIGWISERQSISSLTSSTCSTKSSSSSALSFFPEWRWLSRFLIVKGGTVYLLRKPPASMMNAVVHKLNSLSSDSRRTQTSRGGSGGSSSGSSLCSSGSDASHSSSCGTNFDPNEHTSTEMVSLEVVTKLRKSCKTARFNRLNRDLENHLREQSFACLPCYKSDFRVVKPAEQTDQKSHCFMILNGSPLDKRYFSTENAADLRAVQQAWTRANYQSVMKLENKTFTTVFVEENLFGSLILDWQFGFSFYDPKSRQYQWSYKFYQLKHSSDDGKSRLSLTFVTDPNDSRKTKTHILECSCLQTLIYCIHAFLSAKVYSLYI